MFEYFINFLQGVIFDCEEYFSENCNKDAILLQQYTCYNTCPVRERNKKPQKTITYAKNEKDIYHITFTIEDHKYNQIPDKIDESHLQFVTDGFYHFIKSFKGREKYILEYNCHLKIQGTDIPKYAGTYQIGVTIKKLQDTDILSNTPFTAQHYHKLSMKRKDKILNHIKMNPYGITKSQIIQKTRGIKNKTERDSILMQLLNENLIYKKSLTHGKKTVTTYYPYTEGKNCA